MAEADSARVTASDKLAERRDREQRETEAIREALTDRAVDLVTDLLGEKPTIPSARNPRWRRKGSFALAMTGPRRGQWFDHEAGQGGDMFALIQRELGVSFREAKEWARQWLGLPSNYSPDPSKATQRRREREAKRAQLEAEQARLDAERIANARRTFNQTGPLASAGKAYLEQTRALGPQRWPDAVRWNRIERAVVVAVTDDAGDVVAVQKIAVAPDGSKDLARWPGRQGKTSEGIIERGVMRLPGAADGPLCICEGPETALTVWAATGYETFATIGNLKRAADFAPKGRRIVLCIDDDPKGQQSTKAAKTAKNAIAAAGGDVRAAWPWQTRRFDKSDFNDLAQEKGLDAVRQRIDVAALDGPALGEIRLSLTQAQDRIEQRVGEFFSAAAAWREGDAVPVHAIGVSVGTGKTEAALRNAVHQLRQMREKGDERAIVIAVPEHQLSDEIAARFQSMARDARLDLRADVWRGRQARRPGGGDDERMCGNIADVREAQRLAVDVGTEICPTCPLQETCAYLAQRGVDADLWIVAHQALFRPPPKPIARRGIAAVVVDESLWQAGLVGVEGRGKEIPLDSLRPGFLPRVDGVDGMRLDHIRESLAKALAGQPDGPVSRATLTAISFTEETGRSAWALEWRRKVTDGPWRERKHNATLGRMSSLWQAVEALMKPDGPARSGWLQVGSNQEGARVVRVTGRKDIAEAWRVPTLIVDAVLDVDLIRPYWPNVQDKGFLSVRAPHQTIKQVTARAYSKAFLSGDKALQKLSAQIVRGVRELNAEGRAIVIGNKDVVGRLDLPDEVIENAHFNAVAGRDRWNEARFVVIIGRAMPRPSAVERMAAALTGAAVETIPEPNFYQRRDDFRLIRTPTGIKREPAQRDAHPDPTADRILNRIVQGEVTQAIGRGRGVRRNADNPVEVLVFGDVVLTEPVDQLLTDEDVKLTAADRMLAAGGIAFENAGSAAQAYPELWATHAAARQTLLREARTATKPYENTSYGNVAVLPRVAFQRAGAGQKPQIATIDPRRVRDPRAELERIFGPLAQFEALDAPAQEPQAKAEPIMVKVANGTPLPAARPQGGNFAPVGYARPPDPRDSRQQPRHRKEPPS